MSLAISICIPTIRPEVLPHAIRSIQRQSMPDWELVVIGQGDDERLAAVGGAAQACDPRVRYHHLPQRGISQARNAGVERARSEIIAFTDDDCEARPDWLAKLLELFSSHPNAGLVGGAVLAPRPERRGPSRCPSVYPSEALYDPTCASPPPGCDWIGANFAVRATVLRRVGEFDAHLGAGASFGAGEDTDLKLRLEAIGVQMLTSPQVVVQHTYGRRYGLREALLGSRSYARGNGAVAGKLSLQGDPRGRQWVANTFRECFLGIALSRRFYTFPFACLRWRTYLGAYRECMGSYHLGTDGLLRR